MSAMPTSFSEVCPVAFMEVVFFADFSILWSDIIKPPAEGKQAEPVRGVVTPYRLSGKRLKKFRQQPNYFG